MSSVPKCPKSTLTVHISRRTKIFELVFLAKQTYQHQEAIFTEFKMDKSQSQNRCKLWFRPYVYRL